MLDIELILFTFKLEKNIHTYNYVLALGEIHTTLWKDSLSETGC